MKEKRNFERRRMRQNALEQFYTERQVEHSCSHTQPIATLAINKVQKILPDKTQVRSKRNKESETSNPEINLEEQVSDALTVLLDLGCSSRRRESIKNQAHHLTNRGVGGVIDHRTAISMKQKAHAKTLVVERIR